MVFTGTFTVFFLILVAIGCERIYEMYLSRVNAKWSLENGGVEFGKGHFPSMVALHTALLIGPLFEVYFLDRPFIPALAGICLVLMVACQALRYWIIKTLGHRWNTRVIVIPGLPLIAKGPYQFLKHPNYVGVIIEGLAIPLFHSAWISAVVFTGLNLVLLRVRLQCENEALKKCSP